MKKYFIPFKRKGGTIVDWDFTNPIHCLTWHDDGNGYARHDFKDGNRILMHRFIDNFENEHVHHINMNRLDNTHDNLIGLKNKEHHALHKNGKRFKKTKWVSKFPGATYANVTKNPWRKNWQSRIQYNNKSISLGYFEDPLTASILYKFVLNEL